MHKPQLNPETEATTTTHNIKSKHPHMCVCVCVAKTELFKPLLYHCMRWGCSKIAANVYMYVRICYILSLTNLTAYGNQPLRLPTSLDDLFQSIVRAMHHFSCSAAHFGDTQKIFRWMMQANYLCLLILNLIRLLCILYSLFTHK